MIEAMGRDYNTVPTAFLLNGAIVHGSFLSLALEIFVKSCFIVCEACTVPQGVCGESPRALEVSRFSYLALLRSRRVGPPEFSRPKPSRPKPKMLVPVVELDIAFSRPER